MADWTGKTERYVLAGATGAGTGLSWTDAYTDIPDTMVRDYVYYIGAGTYGPHRFNTAASSNKVIYIVKATVADHGTGAGAETGWNASYAAQAIFTGFYDSYPFSHVFEVTTDDWYIDGIYRDENDWLDGTAYGFATVQTYYCSMSFAVDNSGANIDNVTIRYFYMEGTVARADDANAVSVWIGQSMGGLLVTNIKVQYCYAYRNCNQYVFRNTNISLLEYCATKDNWSQGPNHGESINLYFECSNATIRYNKVFSGNGTACVAWTSRGSLTNEYNKVYGNVFHIYTPGDAAIGYGTLAGDFVYHARVFNNTFVYLTGYNNGVMLQTPGVADNLVYNNLWIDCTTIGFNATHDYNAFSGSSGYGEANSQTELVGTTIFNDYANDDFRLKVNTSPGKDLTAWVTATDTFNVDMLGNTRSTWSRGAYEYSSADIIAPVVTITTSDPTIITTNTLYIEGTATDAVGVTECKYRIGAAPDATHGTALAGTNSWSGTAIGFSPGVNTLYVGAADAAGNWGTDSMTVNYNVGVPHTPRNVQLAKNTRRTSPKT